MRARDWQWKGAWLLAAGLAPAVTSAQEPEACGQRAEAERSRCARERYAAREYTASARNYEDLWRDTGAAKYLFNAAIAREAAGSDALALAKWLRYAAMPGLSDADRADVEARMTLVRGRLVPTTIEVTPTTALGPAATLRFEREVGPEVEAFDYPIAQVAGPRSGAFTVYLQPGIWRLRVVPDSPADAYNIMDASHEATFTVDAGGSHVRVALVPEQSDLALRFGPPQVLGRGIDVTLYDPLGTEASLKVRTGAGESHLRLRSGPWNYVVKPRHRWAAARTGEITVEPGAALELHWDSAEGSTTGGLPEGYHRSRALTLGLGLASGATGFLGTILLVRGLRKLPTYPIPGATLKYYRQDDAERSLNLAAWGAGNTGAALGLGVSAGLEALAPPQRRDYIQLGVGSGATLVGLLWHAIGFVQYKNDDKSPLACARPDEILCVSAARVNKERIGMAVSAGLLGAGVGLLVGVASNRLARRERLSKRQHPHVSAFLGPQALGLTLQRNF